MGESFYGDGKDGLPLNEILVILLVLLIALVLWWFVPTDWVGHSDKAIHTFKP